MGLRRKAAGDLSVPEVKSIIFKKHTLWKGGDGRDFKANYPEEASGMRKFKISLAHGERR